MIGLSWTGGVWIKTFIAFEFLNLEHSVLFEALNALSTGDYNGTFNSVVSRPALKGTAHCVLLSVGLGQMSVDRL